MSAFLTDLWFIIYYNISVDIFCLSSTSFDIVHQWFDLLWKFLTQLFSAEDCIVVLKQQQNITLMVFSFAVTSEMVEPFLEGQTLAEALEKKRLFLADYKLLEDLKRTNAKLHVSYLHL